MSKAREPQGKDYGQVRVERLTVQQFMRIEFAEIEFGDAGVFVFRGPNGAGKSSLIRAMQCACAGSRVSPVEPIHNGGRAGKIVLELDNGIRIERKFTDGKKGIRETLTVTDADDITINSPQKLLDKLRGSVAIDPLDFKRMNAKARMETLLKVSAVNIDLDTHDKLRARAYAERRDVNRDVKRLEAEAKSEIAKTEGRTEWAKKAPVIISDLSSRYQAAKQENYDRDEVQRVINEEQGAADDIAEQIKALKAKQNDHIDTMHLRERQLEKMPFTDTKALVEMQEEFETAESTNAKIRQAKAAILKEVAWDTAAAQADALTTKIEAFDKTKADAFASAKMPLKGLGVDDEGDITFKDMVFDQCSDAEQLLISTSIAMAASPRLRVIWIRDGSLLDTKNLAELNKLATKFGDPPYLVVVERVHVDGETIELPCIELVGGEIIDAGKE